MAGMTHATPATRALIAAAPVLFVLMWATGFVVARLSAPHADPLTFLSIRFPIAGLIFAARLNTATPKAGLGFELDVIAACFIGGASASGGVGRVMGAVIGAFIMGVMNNGMSILGIGIDYQQVIKGLVLLAAVCVDV